MIYENFITQTHVLELIILFFICYLASRFIERKIVLRWKMKKIDKATGTQFEKYLKYLFEEMGYRVRHTGKSGDYGADLILYSSNPKEKIVVQAKRYRQPVGQEAVREAVAAVAYYKADKAMVVTNSKFTTAAQQLAKSNQVILYDRNWLYKAAVQKPVKKASKSEAGQPLGTTAEIIYRRRVQTSAHKPDIKMIEHLLDESLEDAGYTIISEGGKR